MLVIVEKPGFKRDQQLETSYTKISTKSYHNRFFFLYLYKFVFKKEVIFKKSEQMEIYRSCVATFNCFRFFTGTLHHTHCVYNSFIYNTEVAQHN
jgi:hypothetical protein